MIKIGMLIADRYEILEKVGTGGMADVYKAKDHTLDRYVAVKVLKQEFSENATFVSKFRVEAQAAARLMHPNIVNVYDVGEQKGIYYIVMELVDGVTLKQYILSKGHLPVREAVTIATQVALGLEAAHRNQIIHRDIKPQNIIISREGKVKVTDFGIAKASTDNTITSNVMGSVHYTSPEQARGGFSDAKSDIYSLGITLYEMLTGKVPFDGDTTVAIAIKQIQDPMPSPREVVPDIPYAVEQIVLKCCEKSPDRRYPNVQELIADLKHSLSDPDGDFVRRYDPNDLSKTRVIPDKDRQKIARAVQEQAQEATRVYTGSRARREAAEQEGTAEPQPEVMEDETVSIHVNTDPVENEEVQEEDERENRSIERMRRVLLLLAALVVGLLIAALIGSRLGLIDFGSKNTDNPGTASSGEKTTTMPVVIGLTQKKAETALAQADLEAQVEYGSSDKYDPGEVYKASVKAGSEIEIGTVVKIYVSKKKQVEVPSVVTMTEEAATSTLEDAGFEVDVKEVYDKDTSKGQVISQDPDAHTQTEEGSTVTITVSQGEDLSGKVQVPSLIGYSKARAQKILENAGLSLGEAKTVIDDDPDTIGTVISQSIQESTYVDKGTAVDVEVSGQMTYSFSGSIQAPTSSEDPNYREGTTVHIVLSTADGKDLINATTDSFPYNPGAFNGILYSSGTLTMTYENTIEKTVTVSGGSHHSGSGDTEAPANPVDDEENAAAATTTVTTTEQKTITRTVQFEREN